MFIYKKLYIVMLCLLATTSLHSTNNQTIFNFAIKLSQQKNKSAQSIAQWLFTENSQDQQILLIINSPLTFKEKIAYLKKIKPYFVTKYLKNVHNCINKPIKKGLTIIGIAIAIAVIPYKTVFSETIGFLSAMQSYKNFLATETNKSSPENNNTPLQHEDV